MALCYLSPWWDNQLPSPDGLSTSLGLEVPANLREWSGSQSRFFGLVPPPSLWRGSRKGFWRRLSPSFLSAGIPQLPAPKSLWRWEFPSISSSQTSGQWVLGKAPSSIEGRPSPWISFEFLLQASNWRHAATYPTSMPTHWPSLSLLLLAQPREANTTCPPWLWKPLFPNDASVTMLNFMDLNGWILKVSCELSCSLFTVSFIIRMSSIFKVVSFEESSDEGPAASGRPSLLSHLSAPHTARL